MSTIQWRLPLEVEDKGREVEGVDVDVEAAHVLIQKHFQELREKEGKVDGLLLICEMGNLRLVWNWFLCLNE